MPPGPDRVTNDDLVIVLSEEVPMGARAYERVRVRVQRVTVERPVTEQVRHEQVVINTNVVPRP